MRSGIVVLALAGCNQLYGLEPTTLFDGPFRGCPAPGETPMFRTLPIAITSRNFPFDYTFDEARTFAIADIASVGIVEGPVDSEDLTPITLAKDTGDRLFEPRVAPEGDQLFVLVQDAALQWTLRMYTRDGPASWQRASTIASLPAAERVSTPSRRLAADQRRWVRRDPSGSNLVEYAEGGGTWTRLMSYDAASLGVTGSKSLEDPQLSPDGLRLVFAAPETVGRPIYYTDRPNIDSAFSPAREILRLSGDAEPHDPILTASCIRLYVVVYPGLTYVEQ